MPCSRSPHRAETSCSADGDRPVLLISAGIGVTPVLAMLHRLAAQHSRRQIWWIHGATRTAEHALAREARDLLATLTDAREHVFYSAATQDELASGPRRARTPDRPGAGRAARCPRDADAYLCGPAAFMADMSAALTALGLAPDDIHTELFGALGATNPGVVGAEHGPPHQPPGPPGTRPVDHVRPQRHRHPVRHRSSEPAGAGRGLRRPDAVVVPHGRVPHVRDTAALRVGHLLPRTARTTRRR